MIRLDLVGQAQRLARECVCALRGHRRPVAAVSAMLDHRCLRCGVRLGLPVTTQTPTMPPVRPPRAGLPPTVAEFESTPEAKAIIDAHNRAHCARHGHKIFTGSTDDRCVTCGIDLTPWLSGRSDPPPPRLPTVAEGIAMLEANTARAKASGGFAEMTAALGQTVEVDLSSPRQPQQSTVFANHFGQERLALSVTITERADGEIVVEHISNGNQRAMKLSEAIAELIADTEAWK